MSDQSSLPSITDLSILDVRTLPHCLLAPQLPNLRRLACRFATQADRPYTFQEVLSLGPQLDFIVCETEQSTILENMSIFADFTLFDVPRYMMAETLDRPNNLHLAKHVRVSFLQRLRDDGTSVKIKGRLGKEQLESLLTTILPALETLVVPQHWRQSALYGDFKALAEKRKVQILHEDDAYGLLSESRISEVFKEYRQKIAREGAGPVAN